ncbi:MAG TPA: alkaline phosphatase family protein [Gemmatimonadaceae bacterium]|nr:alkaline phosphatase family protein [Gemmatimonadaceae bacterium]
MSVVVLVADGARPDKLTEAIDSGSLPALAQMRDEGGLHTITSAFPSVTGPAYAPFLMGRYPGPVGLPGLRWYDRSRSAARMPGHSRSYVGPEMRLVDRDLDPDAPTVFEIVPASIAALNVISRGLSKGDRIGRGMRFVARTARTHFRGNVRGWLAIDRDIGSEVAEQIRVKQPDFVFAALAGIDKTSHSAGHEAPIVQDAMRIVDGTAAEIRRDAELAGRWSDMHLWIVSDHGHSPVREHEDLAGLVRGTGARVIAHPWVYSPSADVAVMVSGNAMAHIYLDLQKRERPWWPSRDSRWNDITELLLSRPSVDLMILPRSPSECEVHSRADGFARMKWSLRSPGVEADYAPSANDRRADTISYEPVTGDPLRIGPQHDLDNAQAYEACIASDYPDALVQIAHLAGAPRSGEIILSASRDWDFRARYEPIPHVSSHGALHREHMLVPLLVNRPVAGLPRRTVDVMPSALRALGLTIPPGLDGEPFT